MASYLSPADELRQYEQRMRGGVAPNAGALNAQEIARFDTTPQRTTLTGKTMPSMARVAGEPFRLGARGVQNVVGGIGQGLAWAGNYATDPNWTTRSTRTTPNYTYKPSPDYGPNAPAAAIPTGGVDQTRRMHHLTPTVQAAPQQDSQGMVNRAYNATAALRGTNPTFDTAYMNKYYPGNFPVNTYDPKVAKGLPGMGYGGVGGSDTGAALRAAADRGDWNAIGRYYASQGQPFAGRMYDTGRGAIDQAALYDRAFGYGIKSKAGRDRAAKMLGDIMGNQMQMDVQALRNQGYLSAQNASDAAQMARLNITEKGLADRAAALREAETPYKQTEADWRKSEISKNKLAQTIAPYDSELSRLEKQISSALSSGRQADVAMLQAQYNALALQRQQALNMFNAIGTIPTQQSMMLDEQKFAQGGQVQPVLNPMGNMGMPSSMASLDPVIRQYGQYVSTATQYGLNPLPLTKFIDLMASARQQLQQLPTQAGMQMMADGGLVDDENLPWWKRMLGMGGNSERDQLVQEYEARKQQTNMNAIPADSGRVGLTSLPQAMKNRQDRLDEIMQEIRGYAAGGAIPVAGKKVIGPGTGTSDSIPAVVDGSRPAALSSGEFVFPKQAVQYFGTDKLNKMIEKAKGTK